MVGRVLALLGENANVVAAAITILPRGPMGSAAIGEGDVGSASGGGISGDGGDGQLRWHAVELENEAGGEVATAGGVQEAEPRKNPSKSSQPSLRLSSDAMMAAY